MGYFLDQGYSCYKGIIKSLEKMDEQLFDADILLEGLRRVIFYIHKGVEYGLVKESGEFTAHEVVKSLLPKKMQDVFSISTQELEAEKKSLYQVCELLAE